MGISYAGVNLPLPTRRVASEIRKQLSLRKTRLFNMRMASTERIAQSNAGQMTRFNQHAIDRKGAMTTDRFSILSLDGDQDRFGSGWADPGWGGWGFGQASVTPKSPTVTGFQFSPGFTNIVSLGELSLISLSGFNIPGETVLPLSSDQRTVIWNMGGNGFNGAAWESDGFFDPDLPIDVGTLYWPTGASRWAVGYFLVTDEQLAEIRKKTFGKYPGASAQQGQGSIAQPFVMSGAGGKDGKIETLLYMLPAWPLLGVPGGDGLNLLTLVDDRYFWRARRFPYGSEHHKTGESDWHFTLRRFASTIVNNSVLVDELPTGYTDQGWFDQHPTTWEIDFMCHNMGCRVTRSLNGKVRIYQYELSRKILSRNLAAKMKRSITGGGDLLLGPGNALFTPGSKQSDNPAILPSRHVYWVVQEPSGTGTLADFRPLDGIVVMTSDLPGFEKCYGNGLTRHCYEFAQATTLGFGGLAKQLSLDYCRYATAPVDVKFAGIVNYTPEGISDHIEWTYREGEVSTRVQRPPFDNAPTTFYWHEDTGGYS